MSFIYLDKINLIEYLHCVTVTLCKTSEPQRRRFPENFLFGTSTASYEIESDKNIEGTVENDRDDPNQGKLDVIRDKRNGDITRNGQTNYKQDVEMMTELGLNACRLSLSWSSLLPKGLSNKANPDSIKYYNNYINEMIKYNITPIVTLYDNWDLPQNLKERGGFINPLFAEWFEDYACFAYKNFGDRVKYWITFNDPKETCYHGYGYDTRSPIANVTDVKTYYCAKNLVMAHAKAYYAYVKDFKPSQGGFCGIMINVDWFEPLSDSKEDRFAAEIKRQAEWGIFAEPIFSTYGGFPKELSAVVAKKSITQGFFRSGMPEFTKEERDFVKGTSDFFGVNHNTARLVSTEEQKRHYIAPSSHTDADLQTSSPSDWQKSASSRFRLVPNSLLNVVTHLQKKYNNPTMYIADNGWPQQENGENDDFRIKYDKAALNSVLDALEAGVDLRGYIAWSLLDNFERTERYLERFGLDKVHLDCQLKSRILRKSAFVYKQLIKTRGVDPNYKSDISNTWIDDSLTECLSREIHKNPEVHRKLCQHKAQSGTDTINHNLHSVIAAVCRDATHQKRRFSDDFLFGVSTASYQIEGGWNADDKSENIWDHLTHTKPDFIKDRSNGDVAADTYTNYKRDVEMLRELGVDIYRFSLSWARILPNGLSNKVSEAGIQFYNNYINEMLKYNIKPIVVLFHWDLPQKLQDFGGLMNPLFAEWFEDYARVAFKHFGDRVKHWITFNEPKEICHNGYGFASLAPALNATDIGTYYCAKNLVIAHAKAYYAYTNDFKPNQGGVCGITISVNWLESSTDSEEDRYATEIMRQTQWNLYIDPIFSEHGGFPKELSDVVAMKSSAQGYVKSRMPAFTDEERELVRGSADFFGLNHYTANLVSATEYTNYPEFYNEIDAGIYAPPEWPRSGYYWLTLAPNSLFKTVTYIQKKYNSPIIYITESGWPQPNEEGTEDNSRVTYIRAALNDVLDALKAGVDIRGYLVWSLMDNFEWDEGYTQRFGLYEVDFNSQSKTRTPRKSAFVYKHIISSRVIDEKYEPKNLTMWIDEDH